MNSGYIKCVSDGFEVDGYFISSTEVKCHFPSARRSKILHLAVAFGEKDNEFVKRNTVRSVKPVIESPSLARLFSKLLLQLIFVPRYTRLTCSRFFLKEQNLSTINTNECIFFAF